MASTKVLDFRLKRGEAAATSAVLDIDQCSCHVEFNRHAQVQSRFTHSKVSISGFLLRDYSMI